MTKVQSLILAFAAIFLSACYTHRYVIDASASTTPPQEELKLHFLWGLISVGDTSINSKCPSGAAIVENQRTILNALIGMVTGGFIDTTTVRVYCRATNMTYEIPFAPDAERLSVLLSDRPNLVAELKELAAVLPDDSPLVCGEILAQR